MRPFAAVVYRGTWLSGWWCNEPITDVVRRLNLSADEPAGPQRCHPGASARGGRPSGMALPPDRTDRGAERYLKDDWHGLQLFAIDGAQFRTPDKPELREYYGSANTSTKRQNAYPVMRLVALMNLGSHILLNAVTAPYRQSETVLAHSMLATIPDNSITLFDKLFTAKTCC